jgi:hypothetical protein
MKRRAPALVVTLVLISRGATGQPDVPSTASPAQLAAAPDARADDARTLFLEGRRLIEQGRHKDAIPVLLRSQELVPALGTLLNLGLCHRSIGRPSLALTYYRQAQAAAEAAGDPERAAVADTEIRELGSIAARISIRTNDSSDPGLQVSIDGTDQPRETWHDPRWVDPGPHTIRARSIDRLPWQEQITVEPGARYVVAVPRLLPVQSSSKPLQAEPLAPAKPPEPGSTQRVTAIVLGVAGGAGLIVAGVLAASARSTFDSTASACTSNDVCTPEGVSARDSAVARANAATVVTIVSAGVLSAGALLWFTAPSRRDQPHDTRPRIGLGPATIALAGSF